MTQERRAFIRLPHDYTARVSGGGAAAEAQVIDLSVAGTSLSTGLAQELRPGDSLEVVIAIGKDHSLSARLQVAWAGEDRVGGWWLEISSEDIATLRRILTVNLGDAELAEAEMARLVEIGPRGKSIPEN